MIQKRPRMVKWIIANFGRTQCCGLLLYDNMISAHGLVRRGPTNGESGRAECLNQFSWAVCTFPEAEKAEAIQ